MEPDEIHNQQVKEMYNLPSQLATKPISNNSIYPRVFVIVLGVKADTD